jgi:hypothetical protein
MNANSEWSLTMSVGEIDGETDAEAYLVISGGDRLIGRGKARLNPADRDVQKIGAEIAVARALSDLAHQLIHAAAVDIEGVTHEQTHLRV